MIRRLAIAAALTLGLVFGAAPPADAHTVPGDSTPGAEHRLCHLIGRPYGVGTIVGHYRVTGTHRVCITCIGAPHNDVHIVDIYYIDGWFPIYNRRAAAC